MGEQAAVGGSVAEESQKSKRQLKREHKLNKRQQQEGAGATGQCVWGGGGSRFLYGEAPGFCIVRLQGFAR